MAARKHLGWGIVVLLSTLGTQARADSLLAGAYVATNWTTWAPADDSAATTGWMNGVPLVADASQNFSSSDPNAAASAGGSQAATFALPTPVSTAPAVAASSPQYTTPVTSSVSTSTVATTPVFTSGASAASWSAPVTSTASQATANAFINLGAGPYPEASAITTGNAQPWYNSTQLSSFFGGQPTAQQQAAFASAILQRVEQTFQLSGVSVKLTTDPTVSAAHTLSVVSNTSAALLPSALGMTDVGGNGFSFIDQGAKASQSLDQLEWVIAHNVSHELMLAFGVGENYDQTGNYIDARNANMSMMSNPNATFSQAAASALNQAIAAQDSSGATSSQLAQVLDPQAVPEPSSIALWGLLALGGLATAKRRGW